KDFRKINAVTMVWRPIVVQLCIWYMDRAIKLKLKEKPKPRSTELISITYNVTQIYAGANKKKRAEICANKHKKGKRKHTEIRTISDAANSHLVQQIVNMPDSIQQRLLRDNFEHWTLPSFLVIKNFNADEAIENPLPVTATTSIEVIESIDLDEGPEEDICAYIEAKLAQMEKEIQSVEHKRHRLTTWDPESRKPYLMYLPLSDESDAKENVTINDTSELIIIEGD
ncbi:2081_t:CDS:2, partial [Scutellospora calospora]